MAWSLDRRPEWPNFHGTFISMGTYGPWLFFHTCKWKQAFFPHSASCERTGSWQPLMEKGRAAYVLSALHNVEKPGVRWKGNKQWLNTIKSLTIFYSFGFFVFPALGWHLGSTPGFAGFLGSVLEAGFMAKAVRVGSILFSSSSSSGIWLLQCQEPIPGSMRMMWM